MVLALSGWAVQPDAETGRMRYEIEPMSEAITPFDELDRINSMKWIEVKQIDPKTWGLYVAGSLFGTAKNRFDCDHGKVILENAITRVQKGLDGQETGVPE